ncbi:MAG TPA: phosphoribosylanthranilate isomerase [Rhizomicrobium sp.]|jgi:phosphoribosylanthranilate isomerase|nr:phosphoribosylanthranilate isomerase [Rhizomicrobium sp.]
MGVLIKICGITSAEAADATVRAGADFAGLVFHPKSPRHLVPEQAASLAARLRGRVRLAVMLVDPADEAIAAAIAAVKPDFIQLHGAETPARVGAIRSRFDVPVLKVISVADAADFTDVGRFEDAADMLMFDAKPPPGASREGGLGAPFDWQIMRGRKFAKPWLLAGGLNAENVARALNLTEAPGVDVSSGVETAPGIKSPELISQFTAAARAAQFASETRA